MIHTNADPDRGVIWIHSIQSEPSDVEAHISMRLTRKQALDLADAIYKDAHTISAVRAVDEVRPT